MRRRQLLTPFAVHAMSLDFGADSNAQFQTTHWSIVAKAGANCTPDAKAALADLCKTYWYPLYAYVRRRGIAAADAGDYTQGFFAVLLEKGYLARADRERGRFRAFLLTAMKRYLAKQHARDGALKRGGGNTIVSLNVEDGERRYQLEPVDHQTPERIYERRWAFALLDRAVTRVRQDYAAAGNARQFELLKEYLTGLGDGGAYETIGQELGVSAGAVKVAVHRLRQKYRHALRTEVAQTLANADDVDDELNRLLLALQPA